MNNRYENSYGDEAYNSQVESNISPIEQLVHILRIVKRRKKLILAILFFGALASVFLASKVVPSYKAATTIIVDTRKPDDPIRPREGGRAEPSLIMLNSELQVIGSLPILKKVVRKLELHNDDETNKPDFVEELIKKIKAFIKGNKKEKVLTEDDKVQLLAKIIQRKIEIQNIPNTYLIQITYDDIDKYNAQNVVNAIANVYLKEQLETRFESADRQSTWLRQRLSELQQKLRDSQREVQDFKEKNNLLKSEGETLTDKQFKSLNTQIINVRTQVAELGLKYDQLKQILKGDGGIKELVNLVQSESLTGLRRDYTNAEKRRAQLISRYSSKHPSVRGASAEVANLDRQIANEAKRILNKAKNDYEVAKVRLKTLEDSLKKNTKKTSISKQASFKLKELEQEAAANKTLYQNFLTRFKEVSEEKTLKFSDFRVVSKAVLPTEHDGNKKIIKSMVMGIGASVMLAFGIVFLLEFRDQTFRTRQVIENALGIPFITSLPLIEKNELVSGKNKIPIKDFIIKKPVSAFSQSLSSGFFNIKQHAGSKTKKVTTILVTSAIPNEGKTLVAASLARQVAKFGRRVLAIDADMRKASLSSHFYNDFHENGLADALNGKVDWREIICKDEETNLDILPSILGDYNYLDLLDSDMMKKIIDEARDEYDYVIIDTPPVTAVADVHALTKLVDAISIVIEWGGTDQHLVKKAHQDLAKNSDTPIGFILNKVDMKHIGDYDEYPETYSYGYGYGYD